MARKPHKFAHNGVTIDTVLSEKDLREICALAATESTGDLWNGVQKIGESGSGDGWLTYLIKDGLLGWSKLLTFTVEFEVAGGRTTLTTTIQTYMTTQTTLYGIPTGAKKMVAHHTYMQFVRKVMNTVTGADATARVVLRDGVDGLGATLPVSSGSPPVPAVTAQEPEPPAPAPIAPVPSAVDDRTQRVERRPRAAATYTLLPDGLPPRRLAESVVVGRKPVAAAGEVLALPPDENTVSKSHALISIVDGAVFVTDLDSTNGTYLVDPHDDMVQCEPNVATRVADGWGIELGAYAIGVVKSEGTPV